MSGFAIRPQYVHRFALTISVVFLLVLSAAPDLRAEPTDPAPENGRLLVYLLDHQMVSRQEMAAIQQEINSIFEDQAGVQIEWFIDASPRRRLEINELRVLILASDGTRWFHGPSNVIGLAPHDESGIGRNCFIFYRQALWFRQQAVLKCREAALARTQAEASGVEPGMAGEAIAPASCSDYLPELTPMIVARAAAHEMVHILLNKLDHSPTGLMRESFELQDWLAASLEPFRLLPAEVAALRSRLGVVSAVADGS